MGEGGSHKIERLLFKIEFGKDFLSGFFGVGSMSQEEQDKLQCLRSEKEV